MQSVTPYSAATFNLQHSCNGQEPPMTFPIVGSRDLAAFSLMFHPPLLVDIALSLSCPVQNEGSRCFSCTPHRHEPLCRLSLLSLQCTSCKRSSIQVPSSSNDHPRPRSVYIRSLRPAHVSCRSPSLNKVRALYNTLWQPTHTLCARSLFY